ncbi:tetratricopeptide repeat protein [Acinetobacter sp. c2-A9]|uniref:tetratricopeptide repeat protein n=1 Tax=Acinetobacter sp. c2-A9 TaxID=3342802 RepID=UPI0035B7F8C2
MKQQLFSVLFAALLATSSTHIYAYEYQYGSYSEATLKKAQAGDAEAQNTIGDGYYEGNGIEQDYEKAFEWYKKAADKGHLEAMNSLAYMYENGDVGDADIVQAEKWYKKAADKGHALSQYMLSYLYRDNEEFQNKKLYREYLIKAADNGHDPAQNELAYNYEKGQYGFKENINAAVKYYQFAVKQGNVYAMNNLAILYENGDGVEQNITEAVRLYEKSFESGNVISAYNLGYLYQNNELVKKDYKKAVVHYEYVLENTDSDEDITDTLSQLIEIYQQGGYGVKKDLQKVKKYQKMLKEYEG